MGKVILVPHKIEYVKELYELSKDPEVHKHLNFDNPSFESTKEFVRYVIKAEEIGNEVSRVILNKEQKVVGVITLMNINYVQSHCHIGFWIGKEYWGKGYIQDALNQMLTLAFDELNLNLVFAGARKENIRSQKFQEKIPYVSTKVNEQYPEVVRFLEAKENTSCILNVIKKEDFKKYII